MIPQRLQIELSKDYLQLVDTWTRRVVYASAFAAVYHDKSTFPPFAEVWAEAGRRFVQFNTNPPEDV